MKKHILWMMMFVVLTHTGDGHRVAAQTSGLPSPPPGSISTGNALLQVVNIACSDTTCKDRLLQSLRTPNTVIRIYENVSLDLTIRDPMNRNLDPEKRNLDPEKQPPIYVAEGVKVFGSRGPRNKGP